MKKIIQATKAFFKKIWSVIDKYIITPITKIVLRFTGNYDKSGRTLENWLSKKNTLLFISLFIAVIVFIIVDQKIIVFSQSSAEVLKNQPVEVKYNEEAYVIEGIPETVDITIIGNATEIYIAKQSPSNGVKLDLSGLKPGNHKISLDYSQAIGLVDYTVNPAVANITIYQKISESRTLTTDILNQEKLDSKLTIKSVNIKDDQVVIKGAEKDIKKVANVKALIDINNFVKQEVGVMTVKDIPLKAYDEKGNVVDVEILPNKISADIELISSSKEVPIKVIPKGEVAFGYAISSITLSENSVVVYGTEEVLASLEYLPLEVDVDGITSDREYKLELTKPVGVKMLSVNNVSVSIKLSEEATKDIENVPIEYLNLDETKYNKPQALSKEDRMVTVSIKGVKSVIDKITADDIKAYIDLEGYKAGKYEVEVKVTGNDLKVQYVAKTKKVNVVITEK